MRNLFLLIIVIFLFENCKQKADPLTQKTFTAGKIGWTINLPQARWKVMTRQEFNKMNQKGVEVIEEAIEQKIDVADVENLISLKKDAFNYFMASIEPYDSTSFNSYDDMVTTLHQIIRISFDSKKIPADYEIGATRVDGLMLDRYIIKIRPKNSGKTLTQEFYTCLINDYVLAINLVYNNDRDMETLQNILQSSNFTMNSKL